LVAVKPDSIRCNSISNESETRTAAVLAHPDLRVNDFCVCGRLCRSLVASPSIVANGLFDPAQDEDRYRELSAIAATSINDNDWIIADNVLIVNSTPVELGTLGGAQTKAFALNNRGRVGVSQSSPRLVSVSSTLSILQYDMEP
jgi:hypothetical protein